MSNSRRGTEKRRVLTVHCGSLLGEGISSWLHGRSELEVTAGHRPEALTVEGLESLQPETIVIDEAAFASLVGSALIRFLGAHPEVQLIAVDLDASRLTLFSGRRVIAGAGTDLLAAIDGPGSHDIVD